MRTSKRYGWIHSRPDFRDVKFHPKVIELPQSVDLRGPNMPPIYDQGDIGSCTANAIAAAFDFQRSREGEPFVTPSRLFIYANERIMEGTSLTEDSGAEIRDGMKSAANQGICPESEWPYNDGNMILQPPSSCYADAIHYAALQYSSVNQEDVKSALAAGTPVVIGITVYDSFESQAVEESGMVPMPGSSESCLGGHAVLVVGYDNSLSAFIVRNSWGPQWGQNGYFTLPYAYVNNPGLASDFWVFNKVE